MILDLHVHSKYSFDSFSKPKNILSTAKKKHLNGIAITDHNTIKGAIEAREINRDRNFLIIIGAEISTEIGDIIGLFLQEEIKSRNSIKVIEEIHRQRGITVLPHPYKNKGHQLNEEIVKRIDAIEVFNSRTTKKNNSKAKELAERYKKPIIAGSDAHFCSEIGACKVIFKSTDVKNEILQGRVALKTKYTPLYLESASQIIKSVKSGKYNKIPLQLISLAINILGSRT